MEVPTAEFMALVARVAELELRLAAEPARAVALPIDLEAAVTVSATT